MMPPLIAQWLLLAFAVVALIALAAYKIGEARGLQAGIALGRAETPLILREQALSTGYCPSCGNRSRGEALMEHDIISPG